MPLTFPAFREEVRQELSRILTYWIDHTIDKKYGGFVGAINRQNVINDTVPKGIVVNSRILWTYSAAHRMFPDKNYVMMAERAYQYIKNHFVDKRKGGVFWSVSAEGKPLETKKQIYGHAFAVYGLSEYYKISGSKEVLDLAGRVFNSIVKHAYDEKNGGYIEAFNQDWTDTTDYILSKGDIRKSMNTHLHLLEAFTSFHNVRKNRSSAFHLKHALEIILDRIIDPKTYRMTLFFTEKWEHRSSVVSYGHDIEASWLLREAAEVLGDEELIRKCKVISVEMAKAASEGLAPDGSLYYEYEPETKHLNKNKDWWPQAEAMVGFMNAYQLTGKVHFLEKAEKCWDFIKKYMIDHENGEWFWGLDEENNVRSGDKVSFWKCPYHNGRACMEIWQRLK